MDLLTTSNPNLTVSEKELLLSEVLKLLKEQDQTLQELSEQLKASQEEAENWKNCAEETRSQLDMLLNFQNRSTSERDIDKLNSRITQEQKKNFSLMLKYKFLSSKYEQLASLCMNRVGQPKSFMQETLNTKDWMRK